MSITLIDHGQHDPIPYDLGETWQVVADKAREGIQQMLIEQNEREIDRLMGGAK